MYELEVYIMEYHTFKEDWISCVENMLDKVMESCNTMGKYTVIILTEETKTLVWQLPKVSETNCVQLVLNSHRQNPLQQK